MEYLMTADWHLLIIVRLLQQSYYTVASWYDRTVAAVVVDRPGRKKVEM